ncbi:hypothetical protein TNCV_4619381 [Trichonephila clavipes]|nr:hypothetical protein TNCV_4619381 [Trichonephila clavipes]
MLRHYMKDRGLVMGQVDRTQENSKDLGKPRSEESKGRKSNKGNARWGGSEIETSLASKIDTRQGKSPTEGSKQGTSGQYDRTRETRTTTRRTNRAAERASPV